MGMLNGTKGALEEAKIERNKEQQRIFEYLTEEPHGCFKRWMTDEEFGFFCTLCKKWDGNIRNPCAVKFQSGIIGRDAPFYSV